MIKITTAATKACLCATLIQLSEAYNMGISDLPFIKKLTSSSASKAGVGDMTAIGSLTVPTVGVGTISWSSNKLFDEENEDLDELISLAYRTDNNCLFDTAERYGSHWKTGVWC